MNTDAAQTRHTMDLPEAIVQTEKAQWWVTQVGTPSEMIIQRVCKLPSVHHSR